MLLFFSSVASLKSQVDIGLKFGFNISNIVEEKSTLLVFQQNSVEQRNKVGAFLGQSSVLL